MDDVLTPKRAAKVKATYRNPLDSSDTEDSSEEQEWDTHDTEEESSEEKSSEDQELSQASDHAPSPGCRRSSRKLSNRNIPNYDRRYVLFYCQSWFPVIHSVVDNMESDFIRPLMRLCVQLLPGLR